MLIPMPQHMYWQSNQMEMGWKFINSLLHLRNCIIWPRNRNQSSLSCVVESSDFNHLRAVSASLFYGHVPMGLLLIFSVACQFGVQKKKIYRRLFQHLDSPTISIDIYDMRSCVLRVIWIENQSLKSALKRISFQATHSSENDQIDCRWKWVFAKFGATVRTKDIVAGLYCCWRPKNRRKTPLLKV